MWKEYAILKWNVLFHLDCQFCEILTVESVLQGIEYVFIANADNLGATVDLSILFCIHWERYSL